MVKVSSYEPGKPYEFVTDDGHLFRGVRDQAGHGDLHSDGDEPAVVYANGTKWWYRHGKIHRDNAPAILWWNGVEEWWRNGVRHRSGGPAVTYPNNPNVDPQLRGQKQFWANGTLIRVE